MDLSQHKKNIEQRFETYELLQARHLDLMKSMDLPDMKALTLERKQASDDLQSALNRFMEIRETCQLLMQRRSRIKKSGRIS